MLCLAIPQHACIFVELWKYMQMLKCKVQNLGTLCFGSGTVPEFSFKDDCGSESQGKWIFPSTHLLMFKEL